MNHRLRQILVLASSLLVVGCGGLLVAGCGGGSSGGGGPGGGTSRTVSGTATYDFVPATQAAGLDFAAATARPIRNAVLQVMKGTTVLATGSTDASGNYSVTFTDSGAGLPSVLVLARTASPPIEVKNNTDGTTWAVGADLAAGATTLNLHASHGWTGTGYNAAQRAAAPFAILDSMFTAARAFLAVRPAVVFPALVVNWSPLNTGVGGGTPPYLNGHIGTSHFSPTSNQIFILGDAATDTDEYDSHVIVHEWGHYFEHNLSRSDSPGGPHGPGDILDPRLAFGEGYGNGIAAVLLGDPIYVDTMWDAASTRYPPALVMDAENDTGDDPNPSAFSEASVMRILYDVFDPANEAWDGLATGLGAIHDVLVGPEKSTDALTTLGSFMAGLKDQPGVNATAVDTLLAHWGIGPIENTAGGGAFGTGDPNLAGMYLTVNSMPVNGYVFVLSGGFRSNTWYQNQYFVISGNGAQVTISASSTEDVGLWVYQAGTVVASADAFTSGTETVHFNTTAGRKYVVNLVGFSATPADYNVTLDFTTP